jgi:hypothetical protein
MGAGLSVFLHSWSELKPNPHRIQFGCRFYFSSVDVLETWKQIWNPKKSLNPKGIWKKTKNPFIKPDGHPNSTQNPTDLVSGVKFHLQI